jgi:hypothetical protein
VAALGDAMTRDPLASLGDWRSTRHEWEIGEWTVSEEIARVHRREVRRTVLGELRDLIEEAGGIWLCVSAYPFPYRSAFNFRIDHDDFDPRDFDATLRAIAGHEDCTSHFVNASGHESAGESWARLRGLDVGSHGYWHHTYRTVEENVRNMARGIEVIRRQGIEPCGFVAPHGRFSAELHAALVELGIPYSGEFALAYDELPFCPVPGGPLQVPVHPVCLGLFLEAADRQGGPSASAGELRWRAAGAAADYFDRLIHARYRAGEPAFLYGHPQDRLGRYPSVLRRALRAAESLSAMWKTTQANWVAWWEARRRLRLTATEDDGRLVVTVDERPGGWDFGVEYWRDAIVAPMRLEGPVVRVSPAALVYERRPAERLARPMRADGAEGLKTHVRRAIDWERVTPVDEIGTSGWRNRVKRTLRKWVA